MRARGGAIPTGHVRSPRHPHAALHEPASGNGPSELQGSGWTSKGAGRAEPPLSREASTAFDSVSASVFCKIKIDNEMASLQIQVLLNEGHFPKGRRSGLCQLPPRVGRSLGAKGAQEGWTLEGTSEENHSTSWKPEPPPARLAREARPSTGAKQKHPEG